MLKVELWKDDVLIRAIDATDRCIFHDVSPDYYTCKVGSS